MTSKFNDKEIIGIAIVLTPNTAINAVYEDPPPRPTEEYVKATIRKRPPTNHVDKATSVKILSPHFTDNADI